MEIKTKFNIGDMVWIMCDNKPKQVQISDIEINVTTNIEGVNIKPGRERVSMTYYWWKPVSCIHGGYTPEKHKITGSLFATKEEMIEWLMNC